MKKYMIADLVKDLRSDSIDLYLNRWNLKKTDLKEIESLSEEYYKDSLETISLSQLEYPFIMLYLINEYHASSAEAFYLVENWNNEAEWRDVIATAEALKISIEDVQDDDVENVMSMGGKAKGELESSVGLIQWLYDNVAKAFIVYMLLGKRPVMYKITPELMKDWNNSDSMGEYYNLYIRGNSDLEDPSISCGCGPNPCEQDQVDQFKARHSLIS